MSHTKVVQSSRSRAPASNNNEQNCMDKNALLYPKWNKKNVKKYNKNKAFYFQFSPSHSVDHKLSSRKISFKKQTSHKQTQANIHRNVCVSNIRTESLIYDSSFFNFQLYTYRMSIFCFIERKQKKTDESPKICRPIFGLCVLCERASSISIISLKVCCCCWYIIHSELCCVEHLLLLRGCYLC